MTEGGTAAPAPKDGAGTRTEPRGSAGGAVPSRPPWDRAEFRFWVVAISVIALLAAMLSVLALAFSHPKATKVAATAAPGSAASAGQPIDFSASALAGFKARDPNAPAPLAGTVHNVTMHIKETKLEVAPGVKQTMWTFDGQVPGPVYRGKVGDTFNFTIVNDGTMTHSLDFHAGMVSPNTAMVPIEPGKSHVYSFVANHAGIWMYHCGTPPVILHIASGMYGALIIDPPGLPAVDHEFVFLQSELYTGKGGDVPDLSKLLNEQYDAVVFNGYVNQYKYEPIQVQANRRIRVWVLDDGPSDSSSFHVIGTIFDTVYKEGSYLLQPGSSQGGSQALDLQAAQGGFVEFSPPEPGTYTFVTHKFNDASRGALGIFRVGDVSSTMSH